MIIIIDGNELAQLKVPGLGSSLRSNTLHGASIAKEDIGIVVNQLIAGLVVNSCGVSLGNGKTDRIGKSLTQRTSCDFYPGSVVLEELSIMTPLSGLCWL